MKKSKIFTIVACGAVALVLTCVLIVGLGSDGLISDPKTLGPRNNSQSYEVDPADTPVSSIEIIWQDGPVTFGESSDEKIHITESSHKKIDDGDKLELSVKSKTLSLRWDGKWYRRWFTLGLGLRDKALEILLPKSILENLQSLEVSNTSGDITIGSAVSEELEVSSVSGRLMLNSCTAAENAYISTVSGDISLKDLSCAEKMDISTVSGAMEISGIDADHMVLNSVSGATEFRGHAGILKANSVSGDITAALDSCPPDVNLDTVSGRLTLVLPRSSEFTADYDTLSGDFDTDFPAAKDGSQVKVGSGSAKISLNTTSGSMEILAAS